MSQSPVIPPSLGRADERSPVACAEGRGPSFPYLVAAAIAVGRMPGEPADVLHARQRPRFLAYLFGSKAHGPLADPRLEVIRAISASLSHGIGSMRADLVAAAVRVGWTQDDLSLMFPAVSQRAAS